MNPGTQPNNKEKEEIPLRHVKASSWIRKPLTWATGWISVRPSQRRTLNLVLLTMVLPMTLLSVALVTFFSSVIGYPSKEEVPVPRQIDLALERVLETQATALAAIASDPAFAVAEASPGAVAQRLEQFHQAHSEFEALALVDSRGAVEFTAGILHQDFYLWQNTPAFHDSLNNQGTLTISPLKFGVLSLDGKGGLDLSASRIERLIFTTGTYQQSSSKLDKGLLVGIMKTDSLMDSAHQLLNEGQAFLEHPQEDVLGKKPDSNIQLVSASPGGIDRITEELSKTDRATIDDSITPFQGSDASWYSALPSVNQQDIGPSTVSSLTMALAILSVSLTLVAGWVIIKSPQGPELQPSINSSEYSQLDTHHPQADPHPHSPGMSRRLVAVQESVRREMADYLHGHVQSKLLALSMSLGSCQKLLARDPNQASQMLDKIQNELQKVQDEDLRQVSCELYPAIVKMGLVPAMRSLTGRFADSQAIDLVIDADVFALDSAGEAGLPEKQRLGVYRIAEEALSNVMKHAEASHVEVTLLFKEPNRLEMSIADDGNGFDFLGPTNSSHGLALMTDYAEAIGGKTEIISNLKQGTTVSLSLILSPDGPSSPESGDAVIPLQPGDPSS